ncbi:MAG: IS110 family transposase [Candidatus Omnitrophica bacterium]|nr:IS110 family transposase [Candidatus Omnitrophota bacterium]
MYYVGVDLHKRTSWFCILDSEGHKIKSKNVNNDHSELTEFIKNIPQPFEIAVESTYNWYFFVDLVQSYAQKIYLANSLSLKAFAKQHKKNDKIDAHLIADVLYKGFLPSVVIADTETRQIRELLRSRLTLVADRSRNMLRLGSLIDKLGIPSGRLYPSVGNMDNHIVSENIPVIYQAIIEDYKERIIYFTKKLYQVRKQIIDIVQKDQDMKNLETIPGIGFFSAALIKSEIMDIKRFTSFKRLCAYSGLAPKTFSSANKLYHGPINKNRRKHLQWILLENVYKFIKALPDKNEKFERIKKVKNHNTAKVVLARDFLRIIYKILKEKRTFYYV